MLEMIVCMAKNRVIAKDGKMPWDLPEEYQHFLRHVTNAHLIMGRKNFEINEGNTELKKITKQWLVLSHQKRGELNSKVSFFSQAELFSFLKNKKEKISVIGGEEIYQIFLPHVQVLHLSIVDASYEGDVFFPEHEKLKWKTTTHYRHEKEKWAYYQLTREV